MIIYLSVLMKRFTYTLMLAAMCLPAAFGATPEQMDRARAIAYKYCLRYMNNGSGYLDDKKPKSTAELKSALKEKEKENIKVLEKSPYLLKASTPHGIKRNSINSGKTLSSPTNP